MMEQVFALAEEWHQQREIYLLELGERAYDAIAIATLAMCKQAL